MLVYNNGSGGTTPLSYRTWDGSTWSGPTNITVSAGIAGEAQQMRLAASPDSDEMVLVVANDSNDQYALVWNGSSWGNEVTLANDAATNDRTAVQVAYEQQSGDAMVIYSHADSNVYHQTWNGSAWSGEATLTAPGGVSGQTYWTDLASDPNSDQLVLGARSSANDTWLSVWDGSSWGSTILASTEETATADFPGVAVAFEADSGDALAVYTRDNNKVGMRTWEGTSWSAQSDGPDLGHKVRSITLDARPQTNQIVMMGGDDSMDVHAVHWDGASWGAREDFETDSNEVKNQPFLFLWDRDTAAEAAPLETGFWLSTKDDVNSNGGAGLHAWAEGEALRFGDPGLELEPVSGTTSGTLMPAFNLDVLAGTDTGIDALHYVTTDIQIGSSNFDLFAGDVLISMESNKTIPGLGTVNKEDIFVFRPTTSGDYSAGTFLRLLDDPGGVDVRGLTLIEKNITVGDNPLQAGDFLIVDSNKRIWLYETTDVAPSTSGTLTLFLDGGDTNVNISKNLIGIDLIEDATTIGGHSLAAGTVVITVDGSDTVGKAPGVAVNEHDLVALTVVKTTPIAGAGNGEVLATMILEGADLGLTAGAEQLNAVTTVAPVNQAPVLTPATPNLTAITEDQTGNSGNTVASIVGASISDGNAGAVEGIAVTGLAAGNGTWQYRIGAGAWTNVGVVSATSALLLADTDSLRFVPDGDNGESPDPTITYRAWDQTSETAGTKVNPGAGGGTSAFSTASDTASIAVSSVNDAPTLVGVAPTLPGITEDDTANGGALVSTLLGGVSDVDSGAASGIAITALTEVNGTWQYRLGAGAWTNVGAVSATSALLLASTDSVRFLPDGTNGGSPSFDFRAWDQTSGAAGSKVDPGAGGGTTAFSTGSDTAAVTVSSVNDAPTLVGVSPTLPGITEDDTANSGALVSTLLGGVSDVDSGAASGIAITALTEVNGTWQYRLGAGAWTNVGAVSATSALLLASTDSVRFLPDGTNGGSPSFDFRAWDQTSGAAGSKVNPGAGGGPTAFSTGSDTASVSVSSVNDAPVLDASGVMTLTDVREDETDPTGDTVAAILLSATGDRLTDVDAGASEGIAVIGVDDTNGTWQYRIGAGAWTNVGVVSATSALLLADTDSLRFVPDPGYSGNAGNVSFHGWDQTSGAAGTKVNPGGGGGTSAFSVATETATLNVDPVATILDLFGSVAYSNNDGTQDWTGNWQEFGESNGPGSGVIRVNSDALRIGGDEVNITGDGLFREANLDGADWAELSFDYRRQRLDGSGGSVTLEISGNGGSTWSPLQTFTLNGTDGSYIPVTIDITGFIADDTQIRFIGSGNTESYLRVDNIQIAHTGDGGLNDAPVVTPASPTFPTITEDDVANSGATVASIFGASISDPDPGALKGVAVTGLTATNGTWQYRLGAGAWTDVGAVSGTSALLLRDTDSLRFVPDGLNAGSGTVDIRAWDQTDAGTPGTKVNPGPGGGTGAFSTGTDTASVTATAVNDAPTLVGVSPSLPGITEDDSSNGGALVSTLLGGVSDVDNGAASGMAITSLSEVNGTWQYRIGAGAWTDVGAVSGSSALLLASTDSVRFLPDGTNGGSPSFDFRAWDQTSGAAGTKVDPGVGGGLTAFSTGGDTASINVGFVNDAPTLVATAPTLPGIGEDDTANTGVTVSTLVGGISDVDSGPAKGIAITSLSEVNGTWQYRIGAGAWTDVGAVSATSALLLRSPDQIRFLPNGENGGSPSFDFRGWDQTSGAAGSKVNPGAGGGTTAFSTGSDTASIIVSSVNDAPTLVGVSPTLPGITEDDTANGGVLVSTLLGGVSDVDSGAAAGLAITSLSEVNGTWQYRLGAGAWTDVGAVSATSALLLASTDSVRFVPDGDNGGSSSFGFRAWDQTTGAAGSKVDPGIGGGTSAFSTTGDTASIVVSAVNDAPTLDASGNLVLTDVNEDDTNPPGDTVAAILASDGGNPIADVDTGAAEGIAVTGVDDTNGTWQYRLGAGAWTDVGAVSATSALLLRDGDGLRFVPDAGYNGTAGVVDFRAWDQTSGAAGSKVNPGAGGGTTAFSTVGETATLNVTAVNDAPVLTPASPSFPTITEDDTGNGGLTVAALVGTSISDADGGALEGIAITGLSASNGTWQYRLGAGAWTNVDPVSGTSALLLRDTDSVRFLPDADNAGSGTFSFRAWDQTSGSAGTKLDPGVGGGTTAFSTASDTASITTTAVNDAPTVVAASPTLPGINEDDTSNGGVLVSTLLGGASDVDSGAASGLAITSLSEVNGTWQYRLGAGAWTDVGAVSATSALLLGSADSVRFVPDGDNGGSSSFDFRAWDQTSGAAGSKVNPGAGGGTTAFSTAGDIATINVSPVNDAPTLVAASPALPGITEDDTGNGGVLVSTLLGGVSDVDTGAASGLAITSLSEVNGTWQYRLGAGAWTDVGAVSASSALLLGSTDSVRFVPDGDNGGSSSFDFRAWDQTSGAAGSKVDPGVGGGTTAFSTGSDTASIVVSSVNDAPTLVGVAPTLPGITEDDTANGGVLVSTLLGGVSDVDAGASAGLAITSLTEVNGTWQYRLGAGAWTDVGAVSATSALLLTSADSVRFVPDADNGGSSSFDFRGWDQTSGAAGSKVNPGVGGGTTAFSTGSDTASITVTAVNDAPTLVATAPSLPGITEDDTANGGVLVSTLIGGVSDVDTGASAGLAITSLSEVNGTWQYRLGAGAWTDVGAVSATNALLLASTDAVRFVPDGANGGSSSFDFRGWDQTSGTAGSKVNPGAGGGTTAFSTGSDTASITVSSVNDAPTLVATAPSLPGISEDDTTNPGVAVSTLLAGVSDVDTGASAGLAITSLSEVNGSWQYRLGAGAWTDVGAVSAANALLLTATDAIRFLPDGANGGSSSFDFRAWDQTSGTAGAKVNPGVGGGSTAFSTGTDTASIVVSAVNDAPVLTAGAPSFAGITEDETTNAGQTVASLLGGSVADADAGAVEGIAVTGLASGNGTWQYRVGAGAWTDVGAVSDANALVLQDTDRLRFVPDAQNATSASVTYRAWDQSAGSAGAKLDASSTGGTTAFSTATDTASIAVSAVNDQPTMADQAMGIDENSANGSVVGDAVATDVDLPADALTWTLLAGNTGGAFLVDSATGQIRVADATALDFETNPVFNLTVQVQDPGGLTDTATITVSLNDVPESVLIPDNPPPTDPPEDASEPPEPEDEPAEEAPDDPVAAAPPDSEGDAPVSPPIPPVSAGVPTRPQAPVFELLSEALRPHRLENVERLVAPVIASTIDAGDDPLVLDAAMWQALEQLRRDFDESAASESETADLVIGAAEGASVAIMAGFLSWFLRGGTLLTSLLTTMPLWSRLDPIPVLDTDDDERARLAEEGPDEDEQGAERRAEQVLGEPPAGSDGEPAPPA